MSYLILALSVLFFSLPNFASELILTKTEALKQGFQKSTTEQFNSFADTHLPEKNSLPWPVKFMDEKHTIGNSMVEYQSYSSDAYFHGGDDLRVTTEGEVKAPMDGIIQGHYYSYVTDPQTGQLTKYSKPMSEGGDDLYFEVSIQAPNGVFVELHHVNPNSLPTTIHNLILNGGGPIHQGDVVGYASIWPTTRYGERYNHIHYNIISPAGINLNPEYYSEALTDNIAPVIKNIFAIYKNKKVEVLDQKLNGLPDEIIVSSIDQKGDNIYPLPPTLIEVRWIQDQQVSWDFTQNLFNNLNIFPDIRNVYAATLRLSDGRTFTTQGNYTNTQFLFRLKIPPTATSPLTLSVKDSSGNTKTSLLKF